MNLTEKYSKSFAERGHLCCVGIDPRAADLTSCDFFESGFDKSLSQFCNLIISSTEDEIDIFKFNLAFFLAMGPDGMTLLSSLTRKLKANKKIVILDAKFGDISSTVEAYAEAFFAEKHFSFDSVTVSPLSGEVGLEICADYIEKNDKGLFVWFSSSDINNSMTDEEKKIWESNLKFMKKLKAETNLFSNELFGAVSPINATNNSAEIRKTLTNNFLLSPGFGAQGGEFEDFKKLIYLNDDPRVIVNSSRGIIDGALSSPSLKEARALVQENCIKFTDFYVKALK